MVCIIAIILLCFCRKTTENGLHKIGQCGKFANFLFKVETSINHKTVKTSVEFTSEHKCLLILLDVQHF